MWSKNISFFCLFTLCIGMLFLNTVIASITGTNVRVYDSLYSTKCVYFSKCRSIQEISRIFFHHIWGISRMFDQSIWIFSWIIHLVWTKQWHVSTCFNLCKMMIHIFLLNTPTFSNKNPWYSSTPASFDLY